MFAGVLQADGKFNAGQGTLGVRKDQEGVVSSRNRPKEAHSRLRSVDLVQDPFLNQREV